MSNRCHTVVSRDQLDSGISREIVNVLTLPLFGRVKNAEIFFDWQLNTPTRLQTPNKDLKVESTHFSKKSQR